MRHVIKEQRIRQRLNWFRKAQELHSVTDACVFFGISRKTYEKWWHRYAASAWDRLSLADRSPQLHRYPRQVWTPMARRLPRRRGPQPVCRRQRQSRRATLLPQEGV